VDVCSRKRSALALGAPPSAIGKMIVSRGVGLADIGVGTGLLLSGTYCPQGFHPAVPSPPLDPELFLRSLSTRNYTKSASKSSRPVVKCSSTLALRSRPAESPDDALLGASWRGVLL
jgi:hypothetical protein